MMATQFNIKYYRKELKKLGLSPTGTKAVLEKRLNDALEQRAAEKNMFSHVPVDMNKDEQVEPKTGSQKRKNFVPPKILIDLETLLPFDSVPEMIKGLPQSYANQVAKMSGLKKREVVEKEIQLEEMTSETETETEEEEEIEDEVLSFRTKRELSGLGDDVVAERKKRKTEEELKYKKYKNKKYQKKKKYKGFYDKQAKLNRSQLNQEQREFFAAAARELSLAKEDKERAEELEELEQEVEDLKKTLVRKDELIAVMKAHVMEKDDTIKWMQSKTAQDIVPHEILHNWVKMAEYLQTCQTLRQLAVPITSPPLNEPLQTPTQDKVT